MSVGTPLLKADVDNSLSREIGDVWRALNTIHVRNLWLADSSHSTAFMGTLGYTTPEDTTLRAAIGDLNSLWLISHAQGTQPAANDFFFSAKLLGGINWYG